MSRHQEHAMTYTPVSEPDRKQHLVHFLSRTLGRFIDSLPDFPRHFQIPNVRNIHDIKGLRQQVNQAAACLDGGDEFSILLYRIMTEKDIEMAGSLDRLETLIQGGQVSYDMLNEEELFSAEYVLVDGDDEPAGPSGCGMPDLKRHRQRLVNAVLAFILARSTRDRCLDRDQAHPQNFRHILSYFSEKRPEFLLVYDTLIRIILGRDRFAIQERGRASRTLINNFRVEDVFIVISLDERIDAAEKDFIFSWLIAYHKLFRKVTETYYDKKKIKERIARLWFRKGSRQERMIARSIDADVKVPKYVKLFIDYVVREIPECIESIGKLLIFTVNNEDILRTLCAILHEEPDFMEAPGVLPKIYGAVAGLMQEYRDLCTRHIGDLHQIKHAFSAISRERRITETIIAPPHQQQHRTPILGQRLVHALSDETRENLDESNLRHLFDLWPIPEKAQILFNQICLLKDMIPQDREHLIQHYLYREKVLEYLMQIDRLGIRVVQGASMPLLTNAYQLDSLGMLTEGLYLGSTGHWKTPTQKPPGVLCCTNPHAIGNCRGHLLRHVVMRVFMGTGEFYESPFVLDSTLRFGQMDEDGGIQALIMRPGLFLIDIPDEIQEHWRRVQNSQMQGKLGEMVQDKIRQENLA